MLVENLHNTVMKFTYNVSQKFSLDPNRVANLWLVPSTAKPAVKEVTRSRVARSADGPKCEYVYQKGKRPGQACGDPAQPDTTFCSKHKKHAATKTTSSTMSAARDTINGELPAGPRPQVRPPQQTMQLHISLNEFGNYEHKPTGLLFNKETKVVYGRQVGNTIKTLSSADVENCNKFKFNYLPSAVEVPESQNPEDDEQEVVEVVEEVVDEGNLIRDFRAAKDG